MSDEHLFTPIKMGHLELPNRIIMAPLTRNRAGEGEVPTEMNATYYAQRASAGLIITEATQISPEGIGYIHTPGIHTEAQIEGWKKVTKAVHDKGGRIFLQLWHVGRVSHNDLQPGNGKPVAPSAIAPKTQAFTDEGFKDCPEPRALELDEIKALPGQYAQATKNAKEAGFDGVEIHGANGYLLDQFIRNGSNQRTDDYGGSIENRCRLILEVVKAVCNAWDPGNVGIRLAPTGTFNDMHDETPEETFGYLVQQLNAHKLAYLHIMEPFSHDHPFDTQDDSKLLAPKFRKLYDGVYMINGGYDKRHGERALETGLADLVCYGKPYIANPDLVERFIKDAPLNEPDPDTFYGGDEKGYIDYPFMNKSGQAM